MEEVWKDIPWYEGKYQVSNLWNVMSLNYGGTKKSKIMAFSVSWKWYCIVQLSIWGKKLMRRIHRLEALAFIPNPENKPQINHKNWIKTDNRVENLEWVTASENAKHAWASWLKENARKRLSLFSLNAKRVNWILVKQN